MKMSTAFLEVYDTEEEYPMSRQLVNSVSWDGTEIHWNNPSASEGKQSDGVLSSSFTPSPLGGGTFTTENGVEVRVRPLDPYDGVERSRAGVPQPLDVLKAEALRGGGIMAQELTAAVAEDNTVVTLILDTGIGTYVRFGGDWQLLTDGSESLDDTWSLPVAPEALRLFDHADAANVTLSAFDLPRNETLQDGRTVKVLPDPANPTEDKSNRINVAPGNQLPVIASAHEVPLAVQYAKRFPAARWFVAKRARALGAGECVPSSWGV